MTHHTPEGLPPHFLPTPSTWSMVGAHPIKAHTDTSVQAYAEAYAREALRAQAASVEPVAVVGDTYTLHWIGSGPIAPIIERHGIKVGDVLYAGAPPAHIPADVEALTIATEALEEIALAGMSGTGQESDEAMTEWHARQAWKFIGIAARAKSAIAARAGQVAASAMVPFDLICNAIKTADDLSMEGDYMLDSNDCIAVVRVIQSLVEINGLTVGGSNASGGAE